ncbi:SDR family oxidoreductase [Winogradskyella sp. A3E31]|uniref:SDR family oxidoreductase n=1 Tax=Winogradskyella sp. A3E31 TaxID=3349637 RepID=UPI00398B35C9
MKNQISIIGCGWLGLSLAQFLISKNYPVKGSTTSSEKLPELKKQNIQPYVIELNEKGVNGDVDEFLNGTSTVIINVPPGLRRNPDKNHVLEIEHLISHVEKSSVSKVIYISSTSVYANTENLETVTEDSPTRPDSENGKQLLAIENRLLENKNFKTIVLRFGGLFGSDRHPAKYLSGRKSIKNPKAPVNLIHKEDCIHIIHQLINQDSWQLTLNAVTPHHPSKKEYYTSYCQSKKMPLPEFDFSSPSKGKIIDTSKLVQLLNYSYKHGL